MRADDRRDATCPHCGRPFSAELLQGGAERHRGFKCPHCRLFVPLARTETLETVERTAS
jgi:DNA-directed RNA polymerase subunit RPC12/RpoP